jgi:N-hydroxyarylamine O-acetyltransferase
VTPAEVSTYLARIGLDEPPPSTLEGLARLQEAHILSVPFENLDIALGRGIDLSPDALFDKIVRRRRGGYCYELNGLFGLMLDALGFERRPVSARVWYRSPPVTPGLTHTLNVVRMEGAEWLVDVGFGGTTARVPVLLGEDVSVQDADGEVRLTREPEFGYRLTRRTPDGWIEQFSTDARRAYPADMAIGSHFMSTHEDSHFRHAVIVGRFTPEGRDGMVDRTLTVRRGWTVETTVLDDEAYRDALASRFGLDLSEETDRLIATLPTLAHDVV